MIVLKVFQYKKDNWVGTFKAYDTNRLSPQQQEKLMKSLEALEAKAKENKSELLEGIQTPTKHRMSLFDKQSNQYDLRCLKWFTLDGVAEHFDVSRTEFQTFGNHINLLMGSSSHLWLGPFAPFTCY